MLGGFGQSPGKPKRHCIKGILALAEEDFGIRTCKLPTNLAKRKSKPKKEILTPEEVAKLITHAKSDKERGIYYAFPFLTGVRVSEQLGLLWEDIDLERNIINICRVQERDGTSTESARLWKVRSEKLKIKFKTQ